MSTTSTRPGRRAVLGASALTALLTACSTGGDTTTDAAGAPEGGWSFTDDLGVTVTLDAAPTRIAGVSDAVLGLWNYGVKPVAVYGSEPLADDVGFADRDLTDVASVGETYGEIDFEALAAAAPDLIIDLAYPAERGATPSADDTRFGFGDATQQSSAEQIAPLLTIVVDGTVDTVAERTAVLAAALGVEDDVLAGFRTEFDAASERLAAAASSGLSILFVAGYEDQLYVAHPQDDPTLAYYATLGFDMVDPPGEDFYWALFSWETVDQLSADVLLTTPRAMSPEELLAQPTFAALPAAAAGQIVEWEARTVDLVAQAGYMNTLATSLEQFRKLT